MREGNSEEAKARGILKAKGEILGFLCTDNDFTDRDFLRTMVWYAQRPEVDGAYTTQYEYVKGDTCLNRYFALLGVNDPVCWWLGKADRSSYLRPRASGVVGFLGKIPSLGDNGFFIKRSIALKAKPAPETFGSCMCFCEDLRRIGHSTYFVVSTQKLWHRTGESFWVYLKKRWRYVNELYWYKYKIRRWNMVSSSRDWLYVLCFALFSFLVLPQVFISIYGYRQVRDYAWFIHPIVCFALSFIYTWAFLKYQLSFPHITGRRS